MARCKSRRRRTEAIVAWTVVAIATAFSPGARRSARVVASSRRQSVADPPVADAPIDPTLATSAVDDASLAALAEALSEMSFDSSSRSGPSAASADPFAAENSKLAALVNSLSPNDLLALATTFSEGNEPPAHVKAAYDELVARAAADLRSAADSLNADGRATSARLAAEMTARVAEAEERAVDAMESRVRVLIDKVSREEASVETARRDVEAAQREAQALERDVLAYAAVSVLVALGLGAVAFAAGGLTTL